MSHYRYELWVLHEHAKGARDWLFTSVLGQASEPQRGPDIPSTPDTPSYATFLIHQEWTPLLDRRARIRTEEVLARVAREYGGHLSRFPLVWLHSTVTREWGPRQRLGD